MRLMLRFILLMIATCLPLAVSAQTDFQKILTNIAALSRDGFTTGSAYIGSAVTTHLNKVNPDGTFNDLTYTASSPGNGIGDAPFATHLSRMNQIALAYCFDGGPHFNNAAVYAKIVLLLQYWNAHINDADNWYYDQIAYPKAIGNTLVLMREHATQRTPFTTALSATDETNALNYLATRLNPSSELGANRVDESIHWMCRGALTANATVVNVAVVQAGTTMEFVNRGVEGINYDFTFLQHSSQLLTQTYGTDLLTGFYQLVYYIKNTTYAFSATQLNNAYRLHHGTFNAALRGKWKDFNLNGRAISRPGNLGLSNYLVTLALKSATSNIAALKNDSLRISELVAPSYQFDIPNQVHYWNGDYTLHHKPGYFFSVRSVSTRTNRAESINGENLLGTFMTEGVTNIRVHGNEYSDIFPCWNWSKIPGTTMRQFATTPTNPTGCCSSTPIYDGNETFVGGVTDSVYGASTYTLNYSGVTGQKSWFFFDREIVCLGAGIQSTNAEAVATTLNQCLLSGVVNYKNTSGGTLIAAAESNLTLGSLAWVYHNNVGYVLPAGGNGRLTTLTQSGSWNLIGAAQSAATLNKPVFCMQMNHGATPTNAQYQYVVLPGVSAASDVDAYYASMPIQILQNTSAVQAVKHTGLNVLQIIFKTAGTLTDPTSGLQITSNQPCALLIKQVGAELLSGSVADPNQTLNSITLTFSYGSPVNKTITLPSGNYRGASIPFNVTVPLPLGVFITDEKIQRQGDAFCLSWLSLHDHEAKEYVVESLQQDVVREVQTISAKNTSVAQYESCLDDVLPRPEAFRIKVLLDNGGVEYSKWLSYSDAQKPASLFPNPAMETVTVDIGQHQRAQLEFYNVLGAVCLRQEIADGDPISVQHLSPGLYLVRLTRMDGKQETLHLVKE